MSHRKIEPDEQTDTSNVVVLRPSEHRTGDGAKATQSAPAMAQISSGPDSLSHDGLDLLKAFFTIEDTTARASLIVLAQKLAAHSPKK
jgi:hypothetical protein